MRLERCFGSHSPEVIPFRVPELIRPSTEFELFVPSTEVILFSNIDGKKDLEASGQAPEINQDDEPIRTSVNGDWEPFNTEQHPLQNFINLYSGQFSQQMELNRKSAERLIQVAALEGNIILTSLSVSRTRSIDVNPDGTTTGKRGLFWDENPDDKENPYHRVTSVPEGWRIEICGQRIMDELSEKFADEKLQKKFAAKFNQFLRTGIWEAVRREKLTPAKEERVVGRYIVQSAVCLIVGAANLLDGVQLWDTMAVPVIGATHAVMNAVTKTATGTGTRRTLSSWWEYFLPFVEIDRVFRAFSYLNLKGRNLVRLRSEEGKTSSR